MHKSQVFFYILSAFILGVFIASFFNFSLPILLISAMAGISVIILSGFKNKFIILAGFLILAFAGGAARFSFFDRAIVSLNDVIGQEVVLDGYIDSEPEIDGNRSRFVFKVGRERILVTANAYPRHSFGDFLTVEGRPELPQNFTEFDYVTYLNKEGIRTTLFFPKLQKYSGELDLSFLENLRLYSYKNIFAVKNKFQEAVNLSVAEPNASFINGILLGSRQNIPDDLKTAFKNTGTTHILAISGYNIMIISEAVLLGLIWFFKRRTAFWISVAAIIMFVILTGASASVVRAAIMGLLLSFANGYGRLYDQKNSIILAGAAMIWLNPMVLVFDIGFQLSFAAVLGLIYLYPYIDNKSNKILPILSRFFKGQNRGSSISQPNSMGLNSGEIGTEAGGMKELTLMTLSAQITVAPLLIYYFGGFSLVSLPANILILPFVPVAMLFGFMAGLVGMISVPMGQVVGYIVWAITTYQIWIVDFFA